MGRTTTRFDGETYLPEKPGFLKNIPTWELQHLQGNVEHELFESVIAEFTDISGISADYYMLDPDVNRTMDRLYGETTRTSYLPPRQIKLIYEPTEEITMTNTFGIVSEEMIQYSATPKITFSRDVSAGYQPLPGDVIITHWNNRAYEVVDVGEEEKIFQLKKMIWSFILKPYRFSEDSDMSRTIPMGRETGALDTDPLSAYGDNKYIEEQSDSIHDYPDVDEAVYGY
jgi:hypothetical protein